MQPVQNTSYLFGHIASVLHRQADQTLQERLGLGLSQYKILYMLQAYPGVAQKKLADYVGQTEASVSRQVKLLQEKGFVVSRVDAAERRKHLAALTGKGIKITHAANEIIDQFHEPLFGSLSSKEQAQLGTLLAKLHTQSCAPANRIRCEIVSTEQKAGT